MNSTAVVVPVYTLSLTPFEQVSLQQCVRVFANRPVYLVKPEHLDVSPLLRQFPNLRVKSFPNEYFTGISGYNRLLCSEFFYEAFAEHEWMLICQTDAFVFRDDLDQWTARGYDYVGAPQFGDIGPRITGDRTLREKLSPYLQWPILNGGLSLRRLSACIRLLKAYHRFRKDWPGNEDHFFSLHFPRLIPFRGLMNLPRPKEALAFAMEMEPARSVEINGGQLPMGVHAWFKYDLPFWKPYIAGLGFNVEG
ncbi:DUF5672 family protein [Tellurirhabdus rosea]|uniref:DUF5672 family protein n=1 Tax=Tellurirhabdus rosea TaxID=2674997 RepID=UPI002256B433|nr:DUF5672 family protein [Tellurirhabdus rosea]